MNDYHTSFAKKFLDVSVSIIILIVTLPIASLTSLAIKLTEKGDIFFLQNRVGKNGKIFKIFKFRTMTPSASQKQSLLKKLNEADGPVFKIKDDPRFTKFGKALSRTGFDELPQIINVLKGEMSIVGTRPFPIGEARKLNRGEKVRELVNPGITSNWVVNGSHRLSFKEWMKLDRNYVENGSAVTDLSIMWFTLILMTKSTLKLLFKTY